MKTGVFSPAIPTASSSPFAPGPIVVVRTERISRFYSRTICADGRVVVRAGYVPVPSHRRPCCQDKNHCKSENSEFHNALLHSGCTHTGVKQGGSRACWNPRSYRSIAAAETDPHPTYSSSWPNSLPVFRLRKCNRVHAGQMIPSYSFSRTSSPSFDQCWTFIDIVGHLKTNWSIFENMAALGGSTMM